VNDPPSELSPAKSFFHGYALGFDIRDYRGRKAVTHTGGLPGYVSRVFMIPDANLGVSVLTNQESQAAFESIALHVVDHYLGASAFDWIDAFGRLDRRAASDAAADRPALRDPNAKPSLPLASYAGTYRDVWYGDIAIANNGGTLVMTFSHT